MIRIDPNHTLIDSPVAIRVVNLQASQKVTIRLSRRYVTLKRINELEAYATFYANENGVVDLAEQAPIAGTYQGVDGMGLFWSLEVQSSLENKIQLREGALVAPQSFQVTVEGEGRVLDQQFLSRHWFSPDVQRHRLRTDRGLVGTYFCAEDCAPRPGVILFGGSEGGIYEQPAALLASHGFNVLALGYWGIEDLPARLVNIPLEYVYLAIEWMKARDDVQQGWLGVHGTSRGGELALLSASYFPEIKAVVSLNGSGVAFSGIVPWSDEAFLLPAWTYKGEPVPFACPENPIAIALECQQRIRRGENPLYDWYEALSSDSNLVEQATIPVEKIKGSVLLISGSEDASYNTKRLNNIVIERLKRIQHPFHYEHLEYAGAGHEIGIPHTRVLANSFTGGTKKATAKASIDSWTRTIDFLKRSAKGELS